MGVAVRQEAIADGIRELQALLARERPYFRFRPELETGFRQHMQGRVLEQLRRGWWMVLLLYVAIAAFTFGEVWIYSAASLRATNLQVWWVLFLIESAVVAAILLLPRWPLLHGHYDVATTLLAVVALAAIIVGTSTFSDAYLNVHSSYVVVFVLAIIYGMGAFRLWPSLLVCGGAGVVSWFVIRQFDLWLDLGLYLQYTLVANLVGIMLSHMVEQRDRRTFLQGQLLQLEMEQLDLFSAELGRLSREDGLTGLANRRHFNEVFHGEWERARREGQPLALVFVDIDHFKPYNDRYGHLEGDAVLVRVGQALRACLHRPADVAARYGGEEFVLLLPGTPLAGAIGVARHIQAALGELAIPHDASPVAARVTASIGIASQVPAAGGRNAQLLAAADTAAYAAKAAGRNRIMVMAADSPVAVA